MTDRKKNILFVVLLLLLFLPMIQQKAKLLNEKPLTGDKIPIAFPELSWNGWKTGEFQNRYEKALEEKIGFRSVLVRFKNQIQYSLFKKANATGVIVGKKGYLFEEDYIRAYTGGDYLGEWFWKEKFRRTRMVQDTLNALGIKLALILEPGKASYYPEYIPNHYIPDSLPRTNYEEILKQVSGTNLPFLDLNALFMDRKNDADYPHFTKGGIHWSYSGMLESVDTLLDFSNAITTLTIPDIEIVNGDVTNEYRDTDDDLIEILNLMVEPKHQDMHYPNFQFKNVNNAEKPKVLVISDSFYFNILNTGIPGQAFANTAFWYYSKAIYPDTWSEAKDVSMINIRDEVESMDLVMMMVTERFFYKFMWNFIETLFKTYYPNEIVDHYYDYQTKIFTDYQWFDLVVADAKKRNVSLSEALMDHAKYQFWQDEQKGLIKKDVGYYMIKIMSDPNQVAKIKEKALNKNIPFKKQLELDATWIINNN